MSVYIPASLRRLVFERAGNRCEYCQIPLNSSIAKPEIEHILPLQHGGQTVAENLALACFKCNRHKGTNVAGYDLETGDLAPIFNPRTNIWTEYFQIEDDGEIIPLTPKGRVTAGLLRFNDVERIEARLLLIEAGLF